MRHVVQTLLLAASLAATLVSVCLAGNYDSLMEELQRRNRQMHSQYLQRLAPEQPNFFDRLNNRVADLQARHYVRDSQYSDSFDPEKYWMELLDRPSEEAQLRDEMEDALMPPPVSDRRDEEPFVNRIWGSQKVSGGAGKSGQVTGPHNQPQVQQVKTDSLPSYCDPPNPCPIGVNPAKLRSPCSNEVEDTAEFNYEDTIRKMATERCPCDKEHMQCPDTGVSVSAKRSSHRVNPYLIGGKHDKLDSKKSPKFAISKRGVKANFKSTVVEKKNPWLDSAEALDTVEKKDGRRQYDDVEEPLEA